MKLHPVDKKNIALLIFISLLTIGLSIFCIAQNFFFMLVFMANVAIVVINKQELKYAIVLVEIYTVFSFIVIFILSSILLKDVFTDPADSFQRIIYSALAYYVALFPFFKKLCDYFIEAIKREKSTYDVAAFYPNIICKEHLTRTIKTSVLGYKVYDCRKDRQCAVKNNLIKTEKLVGVIGEAKGIHKNEKNYYLNLWNSKDETIKNGDYDRIEVYADEKIRDYNVVINQIVHYLFNEIARYKPINEIDVAVFGDIDLTENTKRLMSRQFNCVEYHKELNIL